MRSLPTLLWIVSSFVWQCPAVAGEPPAEPTAARAESSSAETDRHTDDLARVAEEIRKQAAALEKRPKRKFVSAGVEDVDYRAYMAAWTKKIEQVGNEHYPAEARRLKLRGNVVVTVSIGRDGQVLDTQVLKSSGSQILDEAAVAISRMAGPFPPIPTKDDVDVLHITRTWSFQEDYQVF